MLRFECCRRHARNLDARNLMYAMRDSQEVFARPEASIWQRPIPVAAIVLLALAIHGPLLVMELPATTSYDANLHIFFASHYAHHWFDPWNEKWFGGFSQTTYPPLTSPMDCAALLYRRAHRGVHAGAVGGRRPAGSGHVPVRAALGG